VDGQDANLDVAIERAQAGVAGGVDVLFRALGGSVVGYLRARNVSDPEGLANEVFLRVFRTIHTFRGDGARFRSWLFTIVHNVAIDDARRRRRRVDEAPLERAPEAAAGDVETEVMARAGTEQMHALLDRLSADQRDVLELRIMADLSVEQTAAVVGKSYDAVKALQHRGLVALRRALVEHEAVPQ
jgi:RNA polymerase sigma factor (sigma-70 family)